MARDLPLELVSRIALYVVAEQDGPPVPVAPYTVVSRTWQAAFEPIIYRDLRVYSERVEDDKESKGSITLQQLNKLTSGAPYRLARRSWIRHILYHIVVPHHLEDYKRIARKGYSSQNPVQQENNQAFQDAMVAFFQVLSTWSSAKISLTLRLLGRRHYSRNEESEPNTRWYTRAGEFTWEYRNGRDVAVRPYHARFIDGDSSALPTVSCISEALFLCCHTSCNYIEHRIWGRAALQIQEHCLRITHAALDTSYYIRPDQEKTLQERRQGVADGVKNLPDTLRSFHYTNYLEGHFKENMDAPNVLGLSGVDTLSINMRNLSIRLRELRLTHVTITGELFWPLDESQVITHALNWPNLEILDVLTPAWTLSGKFYVHGQYEKVFEGLSSLTSGLKSGVWLYLPDPDDPDAMEDMEIEDWEENIVDIYKGQVRREKLDTEAMHQLYKAAGYAAQRMPRLRYLRIKIDEQPMCQTLEFTRALSDSQEEMQVKWITDFGYCPDEEVCAAWRISPGRLKTKSQFDDDEKCIISWATYATWPPVDPGCVRDLSSI